MQLPKASPQAAEEYDHRKRLQAVCEAATAISKTGCILPKAQPRGPIWKGVACGRLPGSAIGSAILRMTGARRSNT